MTGLLNNLSVRAAIASVLRIDRTSWGDVPAGQTIATLTDPFIGQGRGVTTYSPYGTVPAQFTLAGNTVVATNTVGVSGQSYSISVLATSGDGRRCRGDTFVLVSTATAPVDEVLFGPATIPGDRVARVWDTHGQKYTIEFRAALHPFYLDTFDANGDDTFQNFNRVIWDEDNKGAYIQASRNGSIDSGTSRFPTKQPFSDAYLYRIEIDGGMTRLFENDVLLGQENFGGNPPLASTNSKFRLYPASQYLDFKITKRV